MTNEFTCVRFRAVRVVGRARVRDCGLAAMVGKALANEKMLNKERITLRSKGQGKPDGCIRKSFIVSLLNNERISVQDPAELEARGSKSRFFNEGLSGRQSGIEIRAVDHVFLGEWLSSIAY